MPSSALESPLFQGFIDFNVALQNVGEKLREANTFAFSLLRKIFLYTSLDRSWQKDSRVRGDKMTASYGLAAIDFRWHFFVGGLVCHGFSV